MNSTIKIEELVPEDATFTLKKTGKTYRLRAITVSDEIWITRTFGERIESIFKEVKMEDVCKVIFHQLEKDDKEDFLAKDVDIINEEGERLKVKIGGAELLSALISGHSEKLHLFEALLTTMGLSRPIRDKIEGSEPQETEKKTELAPIGQ
jgi:hypothetical protein